MNHVGEAVGGVVARQVVQTHPARVGGITGRLEHPARGLGHVAIYVGDGRMIHASSAMGQVAYLDLGGDRAAWYLQNLVAVRRIR